MIMLEKPRLNREVEGWRGLDDPAQLAERIRFLKSRHMTALNNYVEGLRAVFGDVPNFDPFDGGVEARLLVLLETPGPSTAGIRFTSRDNPTGTARNLRSLFSLAQINRADTAIWNAVPWVLGRNGGRLRAPSRSDIAAAALELPKLLSLFPHLTTIILAGKTAARFETETLRRRPDIQVNLMPHPSPVYVNTSPNIFADMTAVFQRVAESLRR